MCVKIWAPGSVVHPQPVLDKGEFGYKASRVGKVKLFNTHTHTPGGLQPPLLSSHGCLCASLCLRGESGVDIPLSPPASLPSLPLPNKGDEEAKKPYLCLTVLSVAIYTRSR